MPTQSVDPLTISSGLACYFLRVDKASISVKYGHSVWGSLPTVYSCVNNTRNILSIALTHMPCNLVCVSQDNTLMKCIIVPNQRGNTHFSQNGDVHTLKFRLCTVKSLSANGLIINWVYTQVRVPIVLCEQIKAQRQVPSICSHDLQNK